MVYDRLMQEFSSVTASSYDAESLAPMLTDKTREGWSVVSIVAAGTNVVAFLSRDVDGDHEPVAEAATETDTAVEATEPAGWGASATPETPAESTPAESTDPGAAVAGAAIAATVVDAPEEAVADAAPAAEPAAAEPETPAAVETPAAAPPADSGVPAGWYADPSGRYELRYWDGTAWTEHVSRAGQQYTDPPVA